MNEKWQLRRAHGRLQLSGELNFKTVPDVYDAVLQETGNKGSVIIDFAGVTRANSAALGLILEWISLQDDKLRFRFAHIPTLLLDIAHISNLDQLLDQHTVR
jgi:anti-anti-sigma factor